MERMVVGFAFFNTDCVVLIRKNRPSWQSGKLNGVGGHVEEGESAEEAMIREFKEETSVDVFNWKQVCVMKGKDFYLDVFTTELSRDQYLGIKSNTDEKIEIVFLREMFFKKTIPNTKFLVEMCREHTDNPNTFKRAYFIY